VTVLYPFIAHCRDIGLWKSLNIPVAKINPYTVNLCAASAAILPYKYAQSHFVTCAIFALFAASLSLLTFCCGVSFFGAGSANCSVVARPPGFVCAHTPVAVKRVASLTCFDILRVC
jgi:hypothetical protein